MAKTKAATKLRIGIFSQNYPSKDNIYNSGFVHSRAKAYARKGHAVYVYCLWPKERPSAYVYEGIPVFRGDEAFLAAKIAEHKIGIMSGHMPNFVEIKFFRKHLGHETPVLLTFNGNESLWSCILYPYEGNYLLRAVKFCYRLSKDIYKKFVLESYIKEYQPKLVFVSQWMYDYSCKLIRIKDVPYRLIPNPIDDEIFTYKQRTGKVTDVLCVRPHSTRKYAIDIVLKAFRKSKYRVVIYGKGKLLAHHKALAKKYESNAIFIEQFFNHQELAALYKKYNFGIMLSRLDSQGISACEMQMTGLPIITSDITGNAEFTTLGTIRLKNEEYARVEAIIDGINRKNAVAQLSKKAHEGMRKIAGIDKVTEDELAYMRE